MKTFNRCMTFDVNLTRRLVEPSNLWMMSSLMTTCDVISSPAAHMVNKFLIDAKMFPLIKAQSHAVLTQLSRNKMEIPINAEVPHTYCFLLGNVGLQILQTNLYVSSSNIFNSSIARFFPSSSILFIILFQFEIFS